MDPVQLATKNLKRSRRRSDRLLKKRRPADEQVSRAEAAVRDREAKAAASARYDRMPWRYVLGRTLREYGRDGCSDLAAGLTYFSVLSALPAMLALVSVLGLLGAGHEGSKTLLEVIDAVAPQQVQPVLAGLVAQLSSSSAAGIGLVVGIVGAVWSASGYVGAFGRAVNRIYGVYEGRTALVLRARQVVITIVTLVLVVVVVLALVLSGPIARSIGQALGVGDAVFNTWEVVKWPLIAVAVVAAVVVLYFGTPNLKRRRVRYVASGAALAVVVMVAGSLLFSFYVSAFGSYNRVYGTVGGLLVALLWIWLANLALVVGAEFGSELERGHELSIGIPAERRVQIEVQGDKARQKAIAGLRADERVGAAIRTATANAGG
ncbi:MAG: YihY/virulence factor BrkB family protein [Humibacter sp.]